MKKPEIIDGMKAEFIGEFSWNVFNEYYDEDGILQEFDKKITVPWTLCKEIFQKMHVYYEENK